LKIQFKFKANSIQASQFAILIKILIKLEEHAALISMFFGANLTQNAFEVVVDSADGASEPTVIFNKSFPKIRVRIKSVRIKSQVEGDSVEVNGIKNSASKLSRTL